MSVFRVLVVDDNPYALQTIKSALAGTGYVVETASNGVEGLEKAAKTPPDVVLLDLLMPGLNGIEVLHRLRATPGLAEVSIVVVTSLDDRATRLEALRAGADEFLGKPVNVPELKARLATLAKVNRYRRLAGERARLAWLAEGSSDGILLLHQDGTIAWANDAARKFLALPPPPGDSGISFLDRARTLYTISPENAFDGWPEKPSSQIDRHLVRPASRSTPALWLQVDLFDGGADGPSVCLRDVTAAVSSFRDSWTVGHILGHKLRTPLNGILGATGVILQDRKSLIREDLDEWISLLADASRRLEQHVQDILGFVERTAFTGPEAPCKASALPALAQRAASLAGKDITLSVNMDAEVEKSSLLPISPGRLESVLFELFRNSLRAHPARKPRIDLRLFREEEGHLSLEVLDDGIHLPPEALEKLLRPCYQLEARPTGELPGTGLGLTYVALLVAEAGGVVRVQNRGD